MGNQIDDALDRLGNALDPILPNRVSRVAVTPTGPGVAIGVPALEAPETSHSIVADFPITVTFDGADRAQVAGVNDLVARCWDACEGLKGCTPLRSRAVEPSTVNGMRRSVVITARMHIASRTLSSPPAPTAAPIPPEPIPV
jgi:hypothetical protein